MLVMCLYFFEERDKIFQDLAPSCQSPISQLPPSEDAPCRPEATRTLEPVGQDLGWVSCSRDGAVKCAMHLVLIRGGLKSQASHASGLHAPTAPAALQTPTPAQRCFLPERISTSQGC
jgi:hypothetical protein